jgi:hypothetical protein
MSHNPKLNVYILTLNSKNDSVETFRDLFKAKYNLTSKDDDRKVFGSYFQDFLNGLGKDEFRKDTKSKKVLGVYKSDEEELNFSIIPHYEEHIIEGVIDGGKYGILREYANIDNKDNKQKLDAKNAVLDKFYILLNTPLNSKYGFLLIQSYTEETIQEPFKDFIKPFFSFENYFFNIIIEPYVPEKFVTKFKEEARIRLFSFSTLMGIGNTLRNDEVKVWDNVFEVTINIKPKESIKPDKNILNTVLAKIGVKKFDNKNLEELESKVFIESGANKRRANFDLNKEIESIRPTIYLEDEGITVNPENSMPDFKAIKEFCFSLIDEVKKEFKKNIDINEL